MRNDRDTFPKKWKKLWIVPLLLLALWAGWAGESAGQMPGERDSLILIGLGETAEPSTDAETLRQALRQAEAVVAVNWGLVETLAAESRSLQQIEVDRTQGPAMTHRILERLQEKSGQESLDQVVRESADLDSTELSGLFVNQSQIEDVLLQARASVARLVTVKTKAV